jgi:hypothetical protein
MKSVHVRSFSHDQCAQSSIMEALVQHAVAQHLYGRRLATEGNQPSICLRYQGAGRGRRHLPVIQSTRTGHHHWEPPSFLDHIRTLQICIAPKRRHALDHKSSQVKSFKIRALWGTPAALQGPGARSLYLIDITPRSVRSNRAAFSSVLTVFSSGWADCRWL